MVWQAHTNTRWLAAETGVARLPAVQHGHSVWRIAWAASTPPSHPAHACAAHLPLFRAKHNRQIFGDQLPTPHGPPFAQHILRELRRVGGVVFTNGDADGWAGGSLGIRPGTRPRLQQQGAPQAHGQQHQQEATGGMGEDEQAADLAGLHGILDEDELAALDREAAPCLSHGSRRTASWSSRQAEHKEHTGRARTGRRLAFVVYAGGASHCTDTHTLAWDAPGQPPRWRRLRARAMDYATSFAQQNRRGGGDADDPAAAPEVPRAELLVVT